MVCICCSPYSLLSLLWFYNRFILIAVLCLHACCVWVEAIYVGSFTIASNEAFAIFISAHEKKKQNPSIFPQKQQNQIVGCKPHILYTIFEYNICIECIKLCNVASLNAHCSWIQLKNSDSFYQNWYGLPFLTCNTTYITTKHRIFHQSWSIVGVISLVRSTIGSYHSSFMPGVPKENAECNVLLLIVLIYNSMSMKLANGITLLFIESWNELNSRIRTHRTHPPKR